MDWGHVVVLGAPQKGGIRGPSRPGRRGVFTTSAGWGGPFSVTLSGSFGETSGHHRGGDPAVDAALPRHGPPPPPERFPFSPPATTLAPKRAPRLAPPSKRPAREDAPSCPALRGERGIRQRLFDFHRDSAPVAWGEKTEDPGSGGKKAAQKRTWGPLGGDEKKMEEDGRPARAQQKIPAPQKTPGPGGGWGSWRGPFFWGTPPAALPPGFWGENFFPGLLTAKSFLLFFPPPPVVKGKRLRVFPGACVFPPFFFFGFVGQGFPRGVV